MRIKVGDTVKIKLNRKGVFRYSRPLLVQAQVAPSTFVLSDGKTWNASHLPLVTRSSVPSSLSSENDPQRSPQNRDFTYSCANLDSHSNGLGSSAQSDPDPSALLDSRSDAVISQDMVGCQEESPGQPSSISNDHNSSTNLGEGSRGSNGSSQSTRGRNCPSHHVPVHLRRNRNALSSYKGQSSPFLCTMARGPPPWHIRNIVCL